MVILACFTSRCTSRPITRVAARQRISAPATAEASTPTCRSRPVPATRCTSPRSKSVIGPIVEAYRPSLAIVSAGFDAHVRDPLGGMELTDLGYAALARRLKASLPEACPIGVLLEGGYDLAGLEGALAASLQVLAGGPPPESVPASGAARIGPTHAREIARSREALSPHWSFG